MHIGKIILGLLGGQSLFSSSSLSKSTMDIDFMPRNANTTWIDNYSGSDPKSGDYPLLYLEDAASRVNNSLLVEEIKLHKKPMQNIKRLRKRQAGVGPQPPDENLNSIIMHRLKRLQEDLNNFKNKVNRISSSTISLTQMLSIKNDFEARIISLNNRIDDIEKSLSQEHSEQINSINQKIQALKSQLTSIHAVLLKKVADIESRINKQTEEIERRREADRHAHKERAIQDCIAAIKDGQIEQAKTKWGHIIDLDNNKYWFKEEVERIIRNAYSSLSYFDKTDHFIRNGLPYIDQAAVGYKTLLEEMKRNNEFFTPEMIRLGYRTKEYMGMPNYPHIGQFYKNIYESLKSSLPSGVRKLLWRNRVCIRNSEHNENLFADFSRSYDSERRYVFTWRPGSVVSDAYWEFIPENNAKRFVIKNTRYNEYLYAAGDGYTYNSQRRNIFTWKPGDAVTNSRWVVEPWNEWSVKIKLSPDNSIGKAEYLYGAGDYYAYDSERRRVFTWKPGNSVSSAYWYIDDCTNRRRRSLLDRNVEDTNLKFFTDKAKLANKTFPISFPSNEALLFSNSVGVKKDREVTPHDKSMNTSFSKGFL